MAKCNMDCFNCKLPESKCHGGDYSSACEWRGANKSKDGSGDSRLAKQGASRKVPVRFSLKEW